MDENEASERAAIVAEAKTWLGTPYVSNGAIKGAGVDCGMILVKVYGSLGLIDPVFDPRPYPAQWALHQRSEMYLGFVEQFGTEVESPLPGDVVLFQFGHCWAHGGIVTEWPEFIHANPSIDPKAPCRYANWRRDSDLNKRRPRFFSAWPRKAA